MGQRQGWKVLVVEDEPRLIQLVAPLKAEGFEVSVARDGVEALRAIRTERPDLVVLDPDLPWAGDRNGERPEAHLNGLAVLVTAGANKDRAIRAAADDVLATPFRARDLVARIRRLQGRAASTLHVGPIVVDRSRWTVSVEGRPVELTATEFRLLWRLLEAKGHVLSREALRHSVWGHARAHAHETRTVDVHIGRLRRKLGAAGRYLITERGVGYRLRN